MVSVEEISNAAMQKRLARNVLAENDRLSIDNGEKKPGSITEESEKSGNLTDRQQLISIAETQENIQADTIVLIDGSYSDLDDQNKREIHDSNTKDETEVENQNDPKFECHNHEIENYQYELEKPVSKKFKVEELNDEKNGSISAQTCLSLPKVEENATDFEEKKSYDQIDHPMVHNPQKNAFHTDHHHHNPPTTKLIDPNGASSALIGSCNKIANDIPGPVQPMAHRTPPNISVAECQRRFLHMLEALSSAEERHRLLLWLERTIAEAKLMGRIVVVCDENQSGEEDKASDEAFRDGKEAKPKNLAATRKEKCAKRFNLDRKDNSVNSSRLLCAEMFRYSSKNGRSEEGDFNSKSANSEQESTSDVTQEENLIVDERQIVESDQDSSSEKQNDLKKSTISLKSSKIAQYFVAKKSSASSTNKNSCVCSECDKSFANKSTLKRHMLLHTGIRHECAHCTKTFSRRDYLKIHLKRCKKAPHIPQGCSDTRQCANIACDDSEVDNIAINHEQKLVEEKDSDKEKAAEVSGEKNVEFQDHVESKR